MTETMKLDQDGQCDCPICGEYHGFPKSVEAHITGKSDDDHRGQVGKDYRVIDGDTRLISEEPANVPIPDEQEQKSLTESGSETLEIPTNGAGSGNGNESGNSDESDNEETSRDGDRLENEDDPDREDGNGSLSTIVIGGLLIVVFWLMNRDEPDNTRNRGPTQYR